MSSVMNEIVVQVKPTTAQYAALREALIGAGYRPTQASRIAHGHVLPPGRTIKLLDAQWSIPAAIWLDDQPAAAYWRHITGQEAA